MGRYDILRLAAIRQERVACFADANRRIGEATRDLFAVWFPCRSGYAIGIPGTVTHPNGDRA